MTQLEIVSPAGEVVALATCDAGERLLDALDEARAPIEFGCRSATCGICMVEVLEGSELLGSPDPIESHALEELGATAHERLACRVTMRAAAGTVKLRPQKPSPRPPVVR